jgi:hypothetical protein
MRKAREVVGVAACAMLVGCAGGREPSTPLRAAVSIPDEVAEVDRAALVGKWSCRELNPMTGRAPVDSTGEFRSDGTGHNFGLIDMAQQGSPLTGRMAVDYTYNWNVQGEQVVVSNDKASIKAADDSPMTGMMAGMAQMASNVFSNQLKPGTANVLKLTPTELVIHNGEVAEAPVLGCTRA